MLNGIRNMLKRTMPNEVIKENDQPKILNTRSRKNIEQATIFFDEQLLPDYKDTLTQKRSSELKELLKNDCDSDPEECTRKINDSIDKSFQAWKTWFLNENNDPYLIKHSGNYTYTKTVDFKEYSRNLSNLEYTDWIHYVVGPWIKTSKKFRNTLHDVYDGGTSTKDKYNTSQPTRKKITTKKKRKPLKNYKKRKYTARPRR